MVIIRFNDHETELQALDTLVGKFPFKTWQSGELMVPPEALPHLAVEGIPFSVQGPASYEQSLPTVRDSASAAV